MEYVHQQTNLRNHDIATVSLVFRILSRTHSLLFCSVKQYSQIEKSNILFLDFHDFRHDRLHLWMLLDQVHYTTALAKEQTMC